LCHPASQKLLEVTDYNLGICNLCNCYQMQNFNGYCVFHKRRTRKPDDKSPDLPKKRTSAGENKPVVLPAKICSQFGAGHKEHVGVGDTPGFECDPIPSINTEGHGFIKHIVFWRPRNTRRLVQTSLFLMQVWRGDVDVKPLL
jgi:hypothetical protein